MNPHSLFWDCYARCYDGLQETLPYRRLLDHTASYLPGSTGVLLDAGCGTGNLLKTIRQRYPLMRLHGLDFSEAMLRRAVAKVADAEFGQADLNAALPYPEHSFDVVTCLNVLYAVACPDRTLAELRRVLKPGGVLIASSPLPRPRIAPIIRAHTAEAGWTTTIPVLARILPLVLFNLLIISRKKTYHFMDQQLVNKLLPGNGISRVYENQNWFACVRKDLNGG